MAAKGFKIVAKAHAKVPRERAFDIVLPIDLPQVFTGYGPLPAVVGTELFDNAWNAAGQSRRIDLSDGNHAIESLNSFQRPSHFGYRIDQFSGPLGSFVDHADGEWSFTENGEGTDIQWSYTWVPKTIGIPVVWIVAQLWQPYADRIVKRCAIVAEQEAS